jgi:hypothetical protein
MRISQIKDQLVSIGDPVEDTELVTTTLNGFPSSWDPFVQGICARSKFPKFNKLWEDCTQEESRLISKSQKTNDDENQALVAQVKKRKEREEGARRSLRNHATRRMLKYRMLHKEMGHYASQCPHKHEKGKKKKHHAHTAEVLKSTSQRMKSLYLFHHSQEPSLKGVTLGS